MLLVAGTYYGQWVAGLRHGYGVRQSAPFDAATPVRYHDNPRQLQQQQQQRHRPRHHNSMPVLNTSLSLTPDADGTTSPQPPLSADVELDADRGRSGFVLTGDRDAEAARGPRRSRSVSVRRRLVDSVLFSSMSRRKRKSDATTSDDASSQVCFCVVVKSYFVFIRILFVRDKTITDIYGRQ